MYNKEKFNANEDRVQKSIFNNMELYKSNIHEWTNEDLDNFLLELHLTSRNTILKYIHVIKKVHKFVCDEMNLKYKELKPTHDYSYYIDYKKLRDVTILSKEEFRSVKRLLEYEGLDAQGDWSKGNYRDVCLVDLGWLGLSNHEIKLLEKQDIIYNNGDDKLIIEIKSKKWETEKNMKKESGKWIQRVFANNYKPDEDKTLYYELDENGNIKIERKIFVKDPEIIDDIIKTKNEIWYYKVRNYTKIDRKPSVDILPFVESDFLIRGADNGITQSKKPIDSPNKALNNQLKKYTHPTIDTEHLSLEDLRRSRMIFEINESNGFMHPTMLASELGKKQESDIAWLVPVAKKLKELA